MPECRTPACSYCTSYVSRMLCPQAIVRDGRSGDSGPSCRVVRVYDIGRGGLVAPAGRVGIVVAKGVIALK